MMYGFELACHGIVCVLAKMLCGYHNAYRRNWLLSAARC